MRAYLAQRRWLFVVCVRPTSIGESLGCLFVVCMGRMSIGGLLRCFFVVRVYQMGIGGLLRCFFVARVCPMSIEESLGCFFVVCVGRRSIQGIPLCLFCANARPTSTGVTLSPFRYASLQQLALQTFRVPEILELKPRDPGYPLRL